MISLGRMLYALDVSLLWRKALWYFSEPHRLTEGTEPLQPEDPARRSPGGGIPIAQCLRIAGRERGPEGMCGRERQQHQIGLFSTFPQKTGS